MPLIIKILRILNGDKQPDLARALGCTAYAISQKERGKAAFSVEEIRLIAKRYNVSLEFLMDGEESKRKILELACK